MRLFSGLLILIASSGLAEDETFKCQANGFGTQPQITVHHDTTNDLLQFDSGFSFAGQNNPKRQSQNAGQKAYGLKQRLRVTRLKQPITFTCMTIGF